MEISIFSFLTLGRHLHYDNMHTCETFPKISFEEARVKFEMYKCSSASSQWSMPAAEQLVSICLFTLTSHLHVFPLHTSIFTSKKKDSKD